MNSSKYLNSKLYEYSRLQFINELSKRMKGNQYGKTSFLGKKHTKETKQKIRIKKLGKQLSSDHKEKISKWGKKQKWWTNGKENIFSEICPKNFYGGRSNNNIGRVLSEETKNKIKNSHTGLKWTQEQKENLSKMRKGRNLSNKAKKELSSRKWYNNGKISIFTSKNPPENFLPGRLRTW